MTLDWRSDGGDAHEKKRELRRLSSIKLGVADGGSGSAEGVELMRRDVSFQNPRVWRKCT